MAPVPARSEDAFVQHYLAPLAAGFPGAFGLRDDCAVISPAPGREFVVKTDAIAEGVHFLADDDPADIGWKALAVNVSDLAAKGATPVAYLLSLSFPELPKPAWMAGFVRGLAAAQRAFSIHLAGGDTDRRPGPISITPMVMGEVEAGRMVRRGAAVAGDIAFVSGSLGDAALGLRLRLDPAQASRWSLSDAATAALVARYLRPQPRLALSAAVLDHARAAMDISDGLLKDLGRMCAASGIGARISHADLPVSPAFSTVRTGDPGAAAAALFAGDDYEILAAVPPDHADRFRLAASAGGIPVTSIGTFAVTDGCAVEVWDAAGQPFDAGTTGWDHFRTH